MAYHLPSNVFSVVGYFSVRSVRSLRSGTPRVVSVFILKDRVLALPTKAHGVFQVLKKQKKATSMRRKLSTDRKLLLTTIT